MQRYYELMAVKTLLYGTAVAYKLMESYQFET